MHGRQEPGNGRTIENPSRHCPLERIPANSECHSRTHSRADEPPVAPNNAWYEKTCGTTSAEPGNENFEGWKPRPVVLTGWKQYVTGSVARLVRPG